MSELNVSSSVKTGTASVRDDYAQPLLSTDTTKSTDTRSDSGGMQARDSRNPETEEDDGVPDFPSEDEVSSLIGKLRSQVQQADPSLPELDIGALDGELEIPPIGDLFKLSKDSQLFSGEGRLRSVGSGDQPPIKIPVAEPRRSGGDADSDVPTSEPSANGEKGMRGETPAPRDEDKSDSEEPSTDEPEDCEPPPQVEENEPDQETAPELTMSLDVVGKLAEDVFETPAEFEAFKKDMDGFEKRAELDGLSKADKEEFYGQVGRVLEESKNGNNIYSQNDLRTIASDMMRQAHNPGLINQGVESTCTTAALETVLYIQEPATIARLVADVATTGRYVTTDGTVLPVPEHNLHPDKYKVDTPDEKKRSLASHIAQPAMINIHWARQDEYLGQTGLRGKISYEEGYPTDYVDDSHSRMMNYSKTPPEPFTTTVPKIDPTSSQRFANQYEGQRPVGGPSMSMQYLPDVYKQLRGNKGDLTVVNDKEGDGVIKPTSEAHFSKIVEDAQARKKPILMGVYANRDPFLSDLSESYSNKKMTDEEKDAVRSMHAHHALVGYRYDAKSGDMEVENQWGNRVDHTGKAGQKNKLSVAAVYDTILEKALPPGTPGKSRSEPTPDEYINQQRKFVETLEKDEDVNPRRTFEERLTLHKYLDHWGRKEEAHKHAELLSKFMLGRIETEKPPAKTDGESNLSERGRLLADTKSFLSAMKQGGENQICKDVLSATDARFSKRAPSTDRDYMSEFEAILAIHKQQGDAGGANKLAEKVVSNVIATALKEPEDLASKDKREVIDNLQSVLQNNDATGQRDRLITSLITNLRDYEKVHGSTTVAGADARSIVIFGGSRVNSDTELQSKMRKEMQENYDSLKAKGDISSPESLLMRRLLSVQYENQQVKDPETLNELAQDSIKYLLTNPDRDGGLRDPDGDSMISPYENIAERLVKGGGDKYAMPLLDKALKIAAAKKPEKIEDIAYKLVELLDKFDRRDEADKILADYKLAPPYRSGRSR